MIQLEHDTRPWGEYWVLEDAKTLKVKRIQVSVRGRLSYQYHFHSQKFGLLYRV